MERCPSSLEQALNEHIHTYPPLPPPQAAGTHLSSQECSHNGAADAVREALQGENQTLKLLLLILKLAGAALHLLTTPPPTAVIRAGVSNGPAWSSSVESTRLCHQAWKFLQNCFFF